MKTVEVNDASDWTVYGFSNSQEASNAMPPMPEIITLEGGCKLYVTQLSRIPDCHPNYLKVQIQGYICGKGEK